MAGVGIVFSQFLQVDIYLVVIIGMTVVLCSPFLGGMKRTLPTLKGAQYCVLIFALSVYRLIFIFLSPNDRHPHSTIRRMGGKV